MKGLVTRGPTILPTKQKLTASIEARGSTVTCEQVSLLNRGTGP
jgi:hypothetical protein